MTTDFSDPTTQIPDFPGFQTADAAAGGSAVTQLDNKETSVQIVGEASFRTFAASSCQRDVRHADLTYQALDAGDGGHRAATLIGCRTIAFFVRHSETGAVRVASNHCKLRWCPLCIRSRRYVIQLTTQRWLLTLDRPKFLTLTLKHTNAPLADQIAYLYKCFREFRRTKLMQSKCRGGIWFFQIKRSTDGSQWHPHLHILIDSNYIPKLELSKTWEQSSRGSKIIDIRQIHSAKKAADYVARYAAAPCRLVDYSAEDSVTIAKALHGLRIVGKFGSAKDVQLSPQKPNDADCWEKIADYTHVVLSRHYDDKSAKIWKAWQDNSPLCVLDKPPKPSDVVPSVDVLNEAPESFRGMQTCFSY